MCGGGRSSHNGIRDIFDHIGADFWREEIMERMVEQVVDQALAARDQATDAAIGLGIDPLFDPVGDEQTRLRSYGIGYRDTPEYERLLSFFEKANEGLYRKLIEVLESEAK